MAKREPPPVLAPAEWEAMKLFWDHGPMAARDAFARLPPDCDWAYKTLKTLLSRLVSKKALAYVQVGNSYLYRAIVEREAMTRNEVRTVFDRLMSSAFSPVLAQFIDEADLSDEEIRELKRRLDEKRKKKTRSSEGKS